MPKPPYVPDVDCARSELNKLFDMCGDGSISIDSGSVMVRVTKALEALNEGKLPSPSEPKVIPLRRIDDPELGLDPFYIQRIGRWIHLYDGDGRHIAQLLGQKKRIRKCQTDTSKGTEGSKDAQSGFSLEG